jgi:hypothetical protein
VDGWKEFEKQVPFDIAQGTLSTAYPFAVLRVQPLRMNGAD